MVVDGVIPWPLPKAMNMPANTPVIRSSLSELNIHEHLPSNCMCLRRREGRLVLEDGRVPLGELRPKVMDEAVIRLGIPSRPTAITAPYIAVQAVRPSQKSSVHLRVPRHER